MSGRPAAAALALALLPAAAAAQSLKVDCADPANQLEINYCAEVAWRYADNDLNAIWPQAKDYAQALDAGLPAAERGIWQALLDGQRAWLTYRDKSCEAAGGPMRGGSGESMLIYRCREQLTRARVGALRDFLEMRD
jgi:uncharacterized protein YecT (DUF1311 family)